MLGIEFKIPNVCGTVLNDILDGIKLEDFIFKLGYEEVFLSNNEFLFKEDIYSGLEFSKLIKNKKYYTVFLNLKLYDKNTNYDDDIENYNDFLNSNCKLILIITDCEYVEIYSKDIKYLNIIKETAIKHNFSNIVDINKREDIKFF
ncbi:MAG: DUF2691 family protein [Bacilli bacterium]|nr:DUF2691 family protein [Bacilli bacterium]